MRKMPRWMQQAIQEQVLTLPEAQEIQQLCLQAGTEEVEMPRHLHPCLERLWLWEQKPQTMH